MIERGKKLGNVKGNNTGMTLFGPTCMNNMGKVGACASSRALSDAAKLVRVQKTICWHMELKVVADDLFNKFACCIKKYYRTEQFGGVI